jgi:GT2 family glycosyltransferase
MPFYCFRLPRRVYATIGRFDEGFGRGGGEDVDYRVRAYLAGFETYLALESYILHFQGKSTWQGGETTPEQRARELEYRTHFRRKWGDELAAIFLGMGQAREVAERRGFAKEIDAGNFKRVIEIALARRNRIDPALFAAPPA